MYRNKNVESKKLKLAALTAVAALAAVLAFLEFSGRTHIFLNRDKASFQDTAKTTSTAPTAQEDFTGGDEREPGNTIRDNEGSGTIEDTGGEIDKNTNTSNPITSASGEISVYSPQENAIIQSGDKVSGTSELNQVSYRMVDSVSGVIATGRLEVVKGKFSGIVNFNTSAREGRIDIFGTKENLAEFSNVRIPVRFR